MSLSSTASRENLIRALNNAFIEGEEAVIEEIVGDEGTSRASPIT